MGSKLKVAAGSCHPRLRRVSKEAVANNAHAHALQKPRHHPFRSRMKNGNNSRSSSHCSKCSIGPALVHYPATAPDAVPHFDGHRAVKRPLVARITNKSLPNSERRSINHSVNRKTSFLSNLKPKGGGRKKSRYSVGAAHLPDLPQRESSAAMVDDLEGGGL
ncbi:hypothetical protein TSAR_012003 [Trichomalopsis sarcophagae]|uniref:Uncharacterized protein n=1 Tax=Trichomalopsis sarcophagae TaxID=543379 RepID=A0A232F520_9HYME|nr:hypothetical protein TSAR_012003 [Trichomalopsis sarcophagae]